MYVPSSKRSCPIIAFENAEQTRRPSIEVLLDECLSEIFKRLPSGKEISVCACVSKRWLTVLSNIAFKSNLRAEGKLHLERSLVGTEATNVRLAAIAIGTSSFGGLTKLSIWANNFYRGVTDAGIKVIARGCPALKDLSLWDVSSVGDEGLSEIAHRCHLLERLALFQCPTITDTSLFEIAKGCTRMTLLSIDSCPNIGSKSLRAARYYCPNLKHVVFTKLSALQ